MIYIESLNIHRHLATSDSDVLLHSLKKKLMTRIPLMNGNSNAKSQCTSMVIMESGISNQFVSFFCLFTMWRWCGMCEVQCVRVQHAHTYRRHYSSIRFDCAQRAHIVAFSYQSARSAKRHIYEQTNTFVLLRTMYCLAFRLLLSENKLFPKWWIKHDVSSSCKWTKNKP